MENIMHSASQRWSLPGLALAVLAGWQFAVASAAENAPAAAALPNPFYAYCVGIGTDQESGSLKAQLELAPMLAELGYAGMAHVGLSGATEMLQALEERQQKLLAVYTDLVVDPGDRGYDPQLEELVPKLKGHGTIVWLVVNSKTYKPSSTEGDARAVDLLQKIAGIAKQSGVAISLYPHKGCYAERMEDVVRLAKKTGRANVGVTFTMCHFLAVDNAKNLDRVLEMARPHLTMVTINGTSGYDSGNFASWIQVLGEGTFDVGVVLKSLRKLDYQGPIGIIAYGIQGDRRAILSRSMQAWKKLSNQAASAVDASTAEKVYELRVYHTNPGKLEALHARFRDHTCALFQKHGIELIGFWTPIEGEEAKDTLYYLIAFPNAEAQKKSWQAFRDDPAWKEAKADSEKEGVLVNKVDSTNLRATDYSPLR
jgi:sugar phosphate isomerase/epimerase